MPAAAAASRGQVKKEYEPNWIAAMQRKYPSPRQVTPAAASRPRNGRRPGPAAPGAALRAGTGPAAREMGRRDGMVLLFGVVLLTLLAVLGSAYLVTSRIDNGQIGNAARGGPADPFGIDAADRVAQIMTSAQTAAERRLFLDAFAFNGVVPANAGTFPSAERLVGNVSAPGSLVMRDPADPVPAGDPDDLMYRPVEADRQNAMPVPGAPPAANQLGVFGPMTGFGGFAAGRGMYDATAVTPVPNANTVHFPYYHVDAVGLTDTHLASRLPVLNNFSAIGQGDEFLWPWISAPLVGLSGFPVDNGFVNPFGTTPTFIDFDAVPANPQ